MRTRGELGCSGQMVSTVKNQDPLLVSVYRRCRGARRRDRDGPPLPGPGRACLERWRTSGDGRGLMNRDFDFGVWGRMAKMKEEGDENEKKTTRSNTGDLGGAGWWCGCGEGWAVLKTPTHDIIVIFGPSPPSPEPPPLPTVIVRPTNRPAYYHWQTSPTLLPSCPPSVPLSCNGYSVRASQVQRRYHTPVSGLIASQSRA